MQIAKKMASHIFSQHNWKPGRRFLLASLFCAAASGALAETYEECAARYDALIAEQESLLANYHFLCESWTCTDPLSHLVAQCLALVEQSIPGAEWRLNQYQYQKRIYCGEPPPPEEEEEDPRKAHLLRILNGEIQCRKCEPVRRTYYTDEAGDIIMEVELPRNSNPHNKAPATHVIGVRG